jgi:hypothetical protein
MAVSGIFDDSATHLRLTRWSETMPPPGKPKIELEKKVVLELLIFCAILLLLYFWLYLRRGIVFEMKDGSFSDPLLVSGLLMALLGLSVSIGFEPSLTHSVRKVHEDQSIFFESGSLPQLYRLHWKKKRFRFALFGATVVFCAVFIFGTVANVFVLFEGGLEAFDYSCPHDSNWYPANQGMFPWIGYLACTIHAEHFAAMCVLGAFFGYRLGVLHANASMFRFLSRDGVRFFLVPGHPDNAGGIAAFGNMMFYSSIFLLGTSLITSVLLLLSVSVWEAKVDDLWIPLQSVLIIISVGYTYYAVYVPFRVIGKKMMAQKHALRDDLGSVLERRMDELRLAAATEKDATTVLAYLKELVEMAKRRAEIDALPNWPIGPVGRRALSFGAVAPLVPWGLKLALPELTALADLVGLLLKPLAGG